MTEVAARAKERRLAMKLTQRGLSERSGVSYGSVKRFEATGLISLDSLLKIALVLNCLSDFDALFGRRADAEAASLDDLLASPKMRKRGSIS